MIKKELTKKVKFLDFMLLIVRLKNYLMETKFNGHNGFNKGLEETIRWLTNKNNLSLYKSELYNL